MRQNMIKGNLSRNLLVTSLLIFLITIYSCIQPDELEETDFNEWLSGGSQTVFVQGSGAFGNPFPDLGRTRQIIHDSGDAGFEATFVSAPAVVNPGLGPIFNNVSCASCHISDGRGRPPLPGEQNSSLLIRLSIPGVFEHESPVPVPGFGLQLQQRGIFGIAPEASVRIEYTEKEYAFADGEKYRLRFPAYALEKPYIPLPGDILISPRVAPPVFGLGLLEAIDEKDIISGADEDDINRDGISGKPNYVWDIMKQKKVLGRFGWKANTPSILQQTGNAYNEDMGITNFLFPEEKSTNQIQSDYQDDESEITDSLLYAVAFYIRTLGVPARRMADNPEVQHGKKVFMAAGCDACHVPRQVTATNVSFPELSHQVIFPYTDMLLHDMGPGLADGRPDYRATGREWRTPPLWGIGLTKIVNGHQNFLHDGRARSLMEAILWHDGEGEKSRQFVINTPESDRDALIAFLNSL